jgi:hypothetical protein
MRRVLIALLFSTAALGGAAPALAQAGDDGTAVIRQDRQSPQMRPQAQPRSEAQIAQRENRGGGEGRRGWGGGQRSGGEGQAQRAPRQDMNQGQRRNWGGGDGQGWQRRQQQAAPQQRVAPQPQAQAQGRWNRGGDGLGWQGRRGGDGQSWQGRRGGDGQNWQGRRDTPRAVPAVPQGSIDRNNDGRVDRYYDRNRNGRLDRNWDRNRDGSLDRRFDRNRDAQLDRRFDRNDNDRLDRRFDRNRDGRFDRRWDGNNRGFDRRWDNNNNRWSGNRGGWDRGWRNDRRYDWYSYRNRYRNYYSLPRYYDPYGYGYRRFSIGIYLDSLFFSNRYWINDPFYYRLPPAPIGTRWVRYYDDVLLVDIDSGYVIDVIHDFFY